mmetsp:Transcript_117538/g.332542  ORF Transcript_117538/g.332542 Transcript_117538/m.332542 type:complete len:202 (-) Transcript_117538:685-1290(-)
MALFWKYHSGKIPPISLFMSQSVCSISTAAEASVRFWPGWVSVKVTYCSMTSTTRAKYSLGRRFNQPKTRRCESFGSDRTAAVSFCRARWNPGKSDVRCSPSSSGFSKSMRKTQRFSGSSVGTRCFANSSHTDNVALPSVATRSAERSSKMSVLYALRTFSRSTPLASSVRPSGLAALRNEAFSTLTELNAAPTAFLRACR